MNRKTERIITPETAPEERDSGPSDGARAAYAAPTFHALFGHNHTNIRPPADIDDPADMRFFMNMSDDIMIVAHRSGEIIKANQAFHDFFGNRQNLNMQNLLQIENFQAREAGPVRFEAQMRAPGGRTPWIEWRAEEKGDLFFYRGRDITGIKKQEKTLEQRRKQLLQAESIGRMGHWRWTIGEDTVEWSEEIFRIFGVDKSFRPTLQSMNAMVNRRDIARVDQAFQRAIIEQNDYDMEFRITRPDGEVRYIRCEGRCALNDDQEVTALYGIMQDMTERMLYEEDLRKAKDSAERAYAAKSQFLANMSHELRTPLNAIMGFSEIIQKQIMGPVGNAKYIEYVENIHESGKHLLDLISDILDMSKIEAGKYELDLQKIRPRDVIRTALKMIESRAVEGNITLLNPSAPSQDLTLIADRRALLQIFLNLLSNAVKFTKPGGSVSIECLEREEYVIFKIVDTGIGIPANKLANITRPFEQAAPSYTRDHDGSGLGLAITKELVEMHGGALFIESAVGIGTTVTVRMPYKRERKINP